MNKSTERLFALGRKKPGEMNKTESKYAAYLDELKKCGDILDYWFEGLTLKLAANTRYTPDFLVMLPNGALQLHEVKGAIAIFRDDAKVKVKVCANMYPFEMLVAYPKKGGGWNVDPY